MKGTQICEYTGDLIDNETADLREAEYKEKVSQNLTVLPLNLLNEIDGWIFLHDFYTVFHQNIGDYMFRLDKNTVIDGTYNGSDARCIYLVIYLFTCCFSYLFLKFRFINHSCNPNCFSKRLKNDGRLGIFILAKRNIKRDEEVSTFYFLKVFFL